MNAHVLLESSKWMVLQAVSKHQVLQLHSALHWNPRFTVYGYSKLFPDGSEGKASACNAGDLASVPGLGRSPGEGNDNPLWYSCRKNPVDGGAR